MIQRAIIVAIGMAVLMGCSQFANAQLSCMFSSSPECRFLASCTQFETSKCSCMWWAIRAAFPAVEHSELVDALETKGDAAKRLQLATKIGHDELDARLKRAELAIAKCN